MEKKDEKSLKKEWICLLNYTELAGTCSNIFIRYQALSSVSNIQYGVENDDCQHDIPESSEVLGKVDKPVNNRNVLLNVRANNVWRMEMTWTSFKRRREVQKVRSVRFY